MKKIKKWTAEEIALLEKNIKIYPTAAEAIRKTAEKIARSADAVSFKYHCWLKKGKKTARASSKKKSYIKTPVITYYNGTMRKAEVIVNNSDLIVAKMDDIVITIQY